MQKLKYFFVILIIALLVFILIKYINNNANNKEEYSSNSQTYNTEKASSSLNYQNTSTNNVNNNIANENTSNEIKESAVDEIEIASYSTPIQIDDENRDKNMEISAKKINGTIIKKGEEFSFNKIVGSPTEEKGYEKAGVFVNGKKVKGYGGGNCQVSTTIYNVALKVKGIKITERHEHGKEVGYVKMGDDATVAYNTLDLKFKNNTNNDIKLLVEVTKDKVIAKILKLEY